MSGVKKRVVLGNEVVTDEFLESESTANELIGFAPHTHDFSRE